MSNWIPKTDMIVGALYRVKARNFDYGVWNGSAVIGPRLKFDTWYPFSEYHYDDGPPFGTVRPIELLEPRTPDDLPLVDYIRFCGECRGPLELDPDQEKGKYKAPDWGWRHVEPASHVTVMKIEANPRLLAWLDEHKVERSRE